MNPNIIIEVPTSAELAVAKYARVPEYGYPPFSFLSVTDGEVSLVGPADALPEGYLSIERGWSIMRIRGTLDFSLTGILAPVLTILAEERIGIFAISTYDTDYILVKSANLSPALAALEAGGYEIVI